ncbi:MAG: hypothetical protein AAFU77_16195 [Myxococcota bacterium]
MNQSALVNVLQPEWDRPDGFFSKLRNGDFSASKGTELLELIRQLDLAEEEPLLPDLIRNLWYLPLFCGWQLERVQEEGGATAGLNRFVDELTSILEEKLGVP